MHKQTLILSIALIAALAPAVPNLAQTNPAKRPMSFEDMMQM